MQPEHEQRVHRRKKQRIKRANFPYQKTLQGLLAQELPTDAQDKLSMLERLDFIEQGQNLILAGNPGAGKAHIAIALGIKAW